MTTTKIKFDSAVIKVGIIEDDTILLMLVQQLALTERGTKEAREVQEVAKLQSDNEFPPDWDFNDIETSFGITVANSDIQRAKFYMATLIQKALGIDLGM